MDGSAHAELSALSTPPSVCTNGSYLHVSTTDYWGLARQGESGNGEDCALLGGGDG